MDGHSHAPARPATRSWSEGGASTRRQRELQEARSETASPLPGPQGQMEGLPGPSWQDANPTPTFRPWVETPPFSSLVPAPSHLPSESGSVGRAGRGRAGVSAVEVMLFGWKQRPFRRGQGLSAQPPATPERGVG